MGDVAFENYTKQIDLLQVFQLEILRKKIDAVLESRRKAEDSKLKSDKALFEYFSGLGQGIDADSARKEYFEAKYGSLDWYKYYFRLVP